MVWNAYNRIGIQYSIVSDPNALQPIQNPHFTYHPALVFQLKDNNAPGDEFLFRGIADVGIAVQQEGAMPWLRAVTTPIEKLAVGGRRQDGITVDDLVVTCSSEGPSVLISLDFIKKENVRDNPPAGELDIIWHDVAVKLRVSICLPQTATLSWYYSY